MTEKEHIPGPWDKEPNEKEWITEGLNCKMIRVEMGHWCGYVGVPEEHPWYNKSYLDEVHVPKELLKRTIDIDKIGILNIMCSRVDEETQTADLWLLVDVHGGLTYASMGTGGYLPKGLWWFGLDCAHCDDLSPQMPHYVTSGTYRDEEYVTNATVLLAKQLKAVME